MSVNWPTTASAYYGHWKSTRKTCPLSCMHKDQLKLCKFIWISCAYLNGLDDLTCIKWTLTWLREPSSYRGYQMPCVHVWTITGLQHYLHHRKQRILSTEVQFISQKQVKLQSRLAWVVQHCGRCCRNYLASKLTPNGTNLISGRSGFSHVQQIAV